MKKIMLIVVIVLVTGSVLYKIFGINSSKKEQVLETVVKKSNIDVTILATGTVQPENRLEIKPPVAGRIEKVLVEEGEQVKKGQVLAWMSSSERAALIDSARSQGSDEVKKWEEIYKPTPIIAPLSGMIIKKDIESGQTFNINDAVLVMSNRLTIKAQVDETDLAQIKKNQTCVVQLDSYPKEKIISKVEHLAYEAKTVNNVTTYLINVLPDVAPEYMRSGMTANVIFYVNNKKDVLVVPIEYIHYENGKSMVLVKDDSNQYVYKEVSLGVSEGKMTEVLSGVVEGDKIALKVKSKEEKKSNPFSPFNNRPKDNRTKAGSSGAGHPAPGA